MNSTAVKPPVAPTKLCHLIKRPDFEGYGFNLHSEKIKPGQYIGKIDVNSPAEAAGLKKGDRIIEVNGVPINSETHKQVVQRIKAIENEVRLLLIDVDANEHQHNHQHQHHNEQQINNNDNGNEKEDKDVVDNHKLMMMEKATTPESMQRKIINSNSSEDNNQDINTTITTMTTTTTTTNNLNANGHNSNNNNNNNMSTNNMPLNNNNNNNNMKITTNDSSHSTTTTTTTNNKTLQLPLTAAEMRAKLMSKKKYDAKSESVDIKKKFQIIQTL